jgi:uncharacterized membrane protein
MTRFLYNDAELKILERRYASSEISEKEFMRMKNDLKGGG